MDVDRRTLQLHELGILKAVDELCRRHGLTWWADGGTCLGAVRHKGFIPWDDDIDIGMPRKDFDEFRRVAKKELPPPLAVWDFADAEHSTEIFIKVHDVQTTCVEQIWTGCEDRYTGVYIDVFPYDGFPGPGPGRAALNARLAVLKRVNWALRIPEREVAGLDRARMTVVRALRRTLPCTWASARMERLMRRYDPAKCPVVTEDVRWQYPAACVRSTVELPFEDMMIPCPVDYDTFLRTLYGDYMQLPPPEERVGHGVAFRCLDKSYLTNWWEEESV